MNKLILNFFGEQVLVEKPKTLDNLKQEISNKFFFSPSDAAEILVSYFSDLKKTFIKTEQDFLDFITKKIYKVDLDISPDSQLYKKSVLQLKEETEKNKKDLEELIKKKEELKKNQSKLKEERGKEIKELQNKIKDLNKIKCALIIKTRLDNTKISDEINNTNQKINELQKKLGIPITEENKNENPKTKPKQVKKTKKQIKKTVKKTIKKKIKKVEKKKNQDKDLFTIVNETINQTVEKITKLVSEQLNKKTKEVEKEKIKIENSKIQLKEEEVKGFFDFNSITKTIFEEINKFTSFLVQQAKDLTNNLSEKYKNCIDELTSMKKKFDDIKLRAPAPKKINKKIHIGIICDGCGESPITGNRYKCAVCSDFNYCEECEEKNKDLHLHPFFKIYSPEISPVDNKSELK